ncbi:MAG: Na/Pi symporter [Planctomycetota bacterium]
MDPASDRAAPATPPAGRKSVGEIVARLLLLLLLLYGFLVAIETMSKAIKALTDSGMLGGGGDNAQLFGGVSNPFAGLALGVLFTVLVQSSSTTTATIVAVVGSGSLSVEQAVPMILGANIGTTITNTLVSVGHVRQRQEFFRAFSAATVHDAFNLMMVAVMLPLEVLTGVLSRTAKALSNSLGTSGGADLDSPVKSAVKAGHHGVEWVLESAGLEGNVLGWVALATGIALTLVCLLRITDNMRRLMAGSIEQAVNRTLEGSALIGVGIGVVLTIAVQSSSVTTSLLVPMCAAGVMRLENAFPIMLGANIGTTVTALLASMAQDNPDALTIALVHLLFNTTGVMACMVFPPIRSIPLWVARWLAARALESKFWVIGYVVGVFILIPAFGWWLWGGAGD